MQYKQKTFDKLTPAELYSILQLRQEIFIIEQDCIYPDIDNKDENAQHFMAFDEGKLVGCLRILRRGVTFEECSIGRVVVSAQYRRKGIAQNLMQQAMAVIKNDWKKQYIRISSQAYAAPVYAALGFRVVSGEYIEDGIPHVEMLCDLSEI